MEIGADLKGKWARFVKREIATATMWHEESHVGDNISSLALQHDTINPSHREILPKLHEISTTMPAVQGNWSARYSEKLCGL